MSNSPATALPLPKARTSRLTSSPLRPMEEIPEEAAYVRNLKTLAAETS
jgi:hypothetical protein